MKHHLSIWAMVGLGLIATPALAHTDAGPTMGLVAGIAHPFAGLDHLLAMVGIGLSAALFGGRALWLLPLAFMSAMALAAAFALFGLPLPFVELGIGLSVIVIGTLAALGASVPVTAAAASRRPSRSFTAMRMARRCRWTPPASPMARALSRRQARCISGGSASGSG